MRLAAHRVHHASVDARCPFAVSIASSACCRRRWSRCRGRAGTPLRVDAGEPLVGAGAGRVDRRRRRRDRARPRDAAELLTWLALLAVPPLAAFALGALLRGSRPWWALPPLPLFAVAWAASGALAARPRRPRSPPRLRLARLAPRLVVPARWLRLGVYAMAALDAGPDRRRPPPGPQLGAQRRRARRRPAAPAGGPLRLGADGLRRPLRRRPRRLPARRRPALAAPRGPPSSPSSRFSFDLLFFAVDSLPGDGPGRRGAGDRAGRRGERRSAQL